MLRRMRIAVIGAGAMGSALARRLAAAGHSVVIGSRDARRGRALAAELGAAAGESYTDAAAAAEVVLLTVPWRAVAEVVPGLPLEGTILIDATNPYLDDTFDGGDAGWSTREEFPPGESGASAIQALAPRARVVKAWNHVWARAAERGLGDVRPAVFLCGDDPQARIVVARLVEDAGYDPHDAGGLGAARWVEALTPLVIALGDSTLALTMTRTPG
jgi:8-hydroxy-5-deazaflavin:NADPH oxidoreductase